MILVHIITEHRDQALEIAKLLLEKKLLFDALLSRKKVIERDAYSGEITSATNTLLIGKTRSLLFNSINTLLLEKYAGNMPNIYCLPIVYMAPENAEALMANTREA